MIVLSACLLHLVVASILARTNLPLNDEGFYGVPAHVLSVSGALRDPVLESRGFPPLRGTDRFFYWMAPMGMVMQAGAFKLFGFGLQVQRELSVVCGTGAILLWFVALRRLLPERVAALATVPLALDFVFLTVSSRGRSDVLSLFFAMAALAAYMNLRERSLALAFAISGTACALCGMVHPNGGLAAAAALIVLIFSLDRSRLRWSYLAIVAACYGVLGLCWGLYVAKAPDLFQAQFFGNVAARFGNAKTSPFWLVTGEVMRYGSAYGLDHATGVKLVRVLLPLSSVLAVLCCLLIGDLRRESKVLLWMFAAVSGTLVAFEGSKQGWYLVHVLPLLTAFLAIWVHYLWTRGGGVGRMAAAAQALILLLGFASLAYTASGRNFERVYQPMESYLNTHVGPSDMVFAGSEVYFGLDCRDTCLRDDANLGVLSGRSAEYIVLNSDYVNHLDELKRKSPEMYQDVERRLEGEYREVFRNASYQVMQRSGAR